MPRSDTAHHRNRAASARPRARGLVDGSRQPEESRPVNVQASLWRSIAVFRVASLVYAAVLIVVDRADYKHLGWAWAVLAGGGPPGALPRRGFVVPAPGRPLARGGPR